MLWLMTYESRIDYFFTIINLLLIPQRWSVVLISFMISEVVRLSPGNFILSPPLLEISVSVVICVKKNGGQWPPLSYDRFSFILLITASTADITLDHNLFKNSSSVLK